MENNNFIRTGTSALVNTDTASYHSARMRNKKQAEFDRLLQKVDKLEQCVENLKSRIKEIENNGNR